MRLRMSGLDLKLAGRMLSKHPGLTLVGGFSIAFAIAVAAMAFEFLTQLVYPSLPVPGGDRIVALRMWDAAASRPERRALHEFMLWRDELRSVDDIGVFSVIERNLRWQGVAGAPVRGAAISEAAFRVAGVPAQLGRTLVPADEELGATPVVVLGHDVWRGAFASAPDIVGRQVRVSGEPHTVVGVMPEGFAFPISESFWVPFQLTSSSYLPLEGPAVRIFGRLAPDANLEGAQVELTTVTQRVVLGNPDTHQQLRAQVLPFPNEVMDLSNSASVGLMSSNGLFILFLILMAANVALLVFVRAATREREILVRVALGADRGRVVTQLAAEALVLGLVGAFVGLLATGISIRWAFRTFESLEGQLPFWFDPSLSLTTVAYALGLTALGALVAGALPGLKITEGNLESRLRQSNTGLQSTRVSRLWSGIIVLQV
ncbi:MAG: ABC transporter permease, partial [Gemmatimonadota bacterium]|nr:ABC transporter permease [Gemmatimonadota bacterium]